MAAGLVAWPVQGHTAHVLGVPGRLAAHFGRLRVHDEAVAVYGGLFLVLWDFNCVQHCLHFLDPLG